ncbi:MAG TPA: hypothetical protein PLZ57_16270 [Pseudobdellovibrionaceae bacterium]|nr:hypothetical protein [Pseudobdellovibrionaceae bacterium]
MKFVLFCALALWPEAGFTSKEGVLTIQKFRLESSGIGTSGPVVVEGHRDDKGKFQSIRVQAFGKTLALDTSIIAQINDQANGVQISYEHGYRSVGGRTIYLVFSKGFTSEVKAKLVLSIDESGKTEIVKH